MQADDSAESLSVELPSYGTDIEEEGPINAVETTAPEEDAAYLEMSCSICYQSMADLAKEKRETEEVKSGERLSVANQCLSCTAIMCHDCLVDWAVATIESLHVPDVWQNIDLLKLKCSSQNCEEIYSVDKLMQILDPGRFEQISFALSRRVLQSSVDFIPCPNTDCASFGFYRDQYGDEYHEVTCGQPFECPSCEFKWHTQAQLHAKLPYFSIAYLQTLDLRKLTLGSNLYKIFCAEVCPGCKVSIVRTGGCPFMECAKCKYQFCWYCLDAFYTEYHYNLTNCPFRYGLLHGIEAFGVIMVLIKLLTLSTWLQDQCLLLLSFSKLLLIEVFFLGQVITLHSLYKKFEKSKRQHARAQKRMSGRVNIPNTERRQLARRRARVAGDSERFRIRGGLLLISFTLAYFFRDRFGLSWGFIMMTLSLMKASAGWLFLKSKIWPPPPVNEAAEEAEDQ